MKYDSLSDLVAAAKEQNVSLSVLVLRDQAASAEKMEEEMFQTMTQSLQVMKESVQDGLVEGIRSASGLTGGDAFKMHEAVKNGKNIR